jgi:HK97 family phage portal protein
MLGLRLPWSKPSIECRPISGKTRVFVNGRDMTMDLYQAALRGKTGPDPRTSGGWDILDGNPQWIGADEIFGKSNAIELEVMYKRASVVYSCVRKICTTAVEAPLKIGRMTPKGWKDQDNHYLNSLMADPNSEMAYSEFLAHYISHLELTGRTYAWKWRNGVGQIGELWPMPTTMIKEVRGQEGKLSHFLVYQGSAKEWLPVKREDMIRQAYPDPQNPSFGLGPLQAAIREVHTDIERQDYIVEMLANARTPGMIFTQPEGWSPDQKDEIRAVILDGLGKGRRGRPLFMDGDGAKIETQAPLKDLDWPGVANLSETRICSAFDVPPIIIGLRSGLENGTYSNYEAALKAFYHAMAGRWKMLDGGLTRGLLRDEGDGRLEVYHDTSDVRGLRDDEDLQVERAVKLYTNDLASKNEAREMVGLPPLDGPEGEKFVSPMNFVSSLDAAEEPTKDDGNPQIALGEIPPANAPAPKDETKPEPGSTGTVTSI